MRGNYYRVDYWLLITYYTALGVPIVYIKIHSTYI